MKKYILTLLFCLLPGFCVAGPGMRQLQNGLPEDDVCIQDTSNLIMDESSMSADNIYQVSQTNAVGQSIQYASPWKLNGIKLHFSSGGSNCVISVRIGSSSDLNTYIEEWASVSVPDGGGLYFFESAQNDDYAASTPYYTGYREISGDCRIFQDSTTPPYAGGAWMVEGTGWALGSPATTRDFHEDVLQCQ